MANDVDFEPEAAQAFHDRFRMTTENMMQALLDIRNMMEQIQDSWHDANYDQLKILIDETVVRLRNFIDNECQQDLQDLQMRINLVRDAFSNFYSKLH